MCVTPCYSRPDPLWTQTGLGATLLVNSPRLNPDVVEETPLAARDPDFAYLAHDLSQLLWAIQGRARALATRVGDEADAVRAIAEDAAAAAAMLADHSEPVADPAAVVAAAWRQSCDRAAARGREPANVTLSGPTSTLPVAMPPHVLRRILGNLFANAIEAMPEGGRITWNVAVDAGRVQLTVADTGPGIPTELHARLFTAGASGGKAEGHGLGLAGSRELARHHGGDLDCDESATFVLELPAASSSSTVPAQPDTPTDSLHILVVDDELPVREMLAELLTCEGHTVTLVAGAEAALAKLEPGDYDAALIDLGLPGVSGPELARSLRAVDPTLAVAMFTGWGRENELEELDPDLVDLTATKPIDLPQLRGLLARAAELTAVRRDKPQNVPKNEE